MGLQLNLSALSICGYNSRCSHDSQEGLFNLVSTIRNSRANVRSAEMLDPIPVLYPSLISQANIVMEKLE